MKLGFEIRCASSLLAVVAVGSLALARPARADWPACGRGIAVAPGSQQHSAIATDGAGGAIVVWQDQRGPSVNIFARRVLATGEPDAAWPVEGRALLTDPAALGTDVEQDSPAIVSDGRGGAIVAWQDNRSPLTGTDLYAQHALKVGGAKRLILSINVLNLWDQRTAVNRVTTMRRTGAIPNAPGYYQEAAFYAGQLNFDQLIQNAVAQGKMTLNPQFLMVNSYQDPIAARVGVKFTF